MPREGESSTSTSTKNPLKRGDACLYCRKRRIRCSAEKPTCQHCKGKRECTYDTGKPVSKVKQLEDKVAELEELLRGGLPDGSAIAPGGSGAGSGFESRRPSDEGAFNGQRGLGSMSASGSGGGGMSAHPQLHHHTSDQSTTSTSFLPRDSLKSNNVTNDFYPGGTNGMDGIQGFDINMLQQSFGDVTGMNGISNDFLAFGSSMFGPTGSDKIYKIPDVVADSLPSDPSTMFDFSTLDPNFMSLVNSFDNTFQPPQAFPQQAQQPQQSTAPPPHQAPFPSLPGTGSSSNQTTESSTGLTPFINQDFSPSGSGPSSSGPSGTSSGIDLAPTPGHHYEHLSKTVDYNINGGVLPGAANSNGPSFMGSAQDPLSSVESRPWTSLKTDAGPVESGVDVLLSQTLGEKSPDSSGPSATAAAGLGQAPTSFSSAFQMPTDTRAGPGAVLDEEEAGFELVGGWFDANDLPRVARDHLLDLFFSGMRMFASIFHIPRFFASLTLPMSKRPHPCLLHSMFLLASRISTSPSIRALENHFYSIASRQLEESIAKADRLFDATRAATMLATYKYSNARYHEGWMMSGLAARLAISCGLHQIPSAVYKPDPLPRDRSADLVSLFRQRSFVIPPPVDAIELGERINAFWCTFMTERCGTISAQWPPSIHDDVITTPYPKPLHEFELGLVSESENQSISTLYDPSPPKQTLPHYATSTEPILRLRALAILERASKLMYLRPEPEYEQRIRSQSQSQSHSPSGPIDEYLYFENVNMTHGPDFLAQKLNFGSQNRSQGGSPGDSSNGQGGKGWMRCAKIRTPKAYEEVKLALLNVEMDLPPERRTDWSIWDGRVQDWHYTAARVDFYSLHFILGCAWMFLFDVFAYNAENTDAVNVARRLTQTIRCMQASVAGLGADFDVFIAMTWSFISKILIREVKRLQALGDTQGAALIESDVEVIISALKSFGQRHNIAGMQAQRAERYRKSTAEEMKFMERDEDENEDRFVSKEWDIGGC